MRLLQFEFGMFDLLLLFFQNFVPFTYVFFDLAQFSQIGIVDPLDVESRAAGWVSNFDHLLFLVEKLYKICTHIIVKTLNESFANFIPRFVLDI